MKKYNLLASTAILLSVFAFANTNAASKIYVCATAQDDDLTQAEYEALTWVEIKGIGSRGESGSNTNIVNYDTWDTDVTQKAKGITDAGSPELEVARTPSDAGQVILNTAAQANSVNYAFKEVRNDTPAGGSTPTIIYNRGIVTGPKRPGGRNEDFDLEVFTLGYNQKEIVVDPT